MISALETVLTGEAEKLLHQHSATVLAKYGGMWPELEELDGAIKYSRKSIANIVKKAKTQLDPFYDRFDPTSKSGVEDLSLFKFIQNVGGSLISFISGSSSRLQLISTYSDLLFPALRNDKKDLSSIILAEENGSYLIQTAIAEYKNTVQNFEHVLAAIYMGTRTEYKKLRRKFLGGSISVTDNDEVEDQLLMSFFGSKPPKKENIGPAVALVDDNCVKTQLFIDIMNNLPQYYEKIIPILNRGKLTGKTKVTKTLDDGEIEDCVGTFTTIADKTFWNYINNPSDLTKIIMGTVKAFQLEYASVARALHALMSKVDPQLEQTRRIIEDQTALVKQYNRINFLSIRPSSEDIAPRTKLDHDVAIARTKLFHHLNETINALSGMDRYLQTTEDFAQLKIKEAIELKSTLDDIQRTETQKNLARNIQDDNEFYIGKSGQLGSLSVEREPAPKIRYEDVIGESFIKAKQHIDEVVKVASHPNIMRLSAPRGDVRSNLCLIGSFGCGKSEMARAIGGDKRIIGLNIAVADLLTAYMHESVKNVKRMYDEAKNLRKNSRHTKSVGIIIDEFDRLFDYGEGVHAAYDGGRMTGVLQEMMDGVVGNEGIFLVTMTNVPKAIPEAILRRFKYVDVVGQLTLEERVKLFKLFLTRGLPIDPTVTDEDYKKWAEMLNHAPGDVIGKVCDEIHFKFMFDLTMNKPHVVASIERILSKKLHDREAKKEDYSYLKTALGKYKNINAEEITQALETIIKQPQVVMQVNKSKQVYRDAEDILNGLSQIGESGLGFGAKKKSVLW